MGWFAMANDKGAGSAGKRVKKLDTKEVAAPAGRHLRPQ